MGAVKYQVHVDDRIETYADIRVDVTSCQEWVVTGYSEPSQSGISTHLLADRPLKVSQWVREHIVETRPGTTKQIKQDGDLS